MNADRKIPLRIVVRAMMLQAAINARSAGSQRTEDGFLAKGDEVNDDDDRVLPKRPKRRKKRR
jgi:hypothetical protein